MSLDACAMPNEQLKYDTRIRRVARIPQADLGPGEIILLNAQRGNYYGLDEISARIWSLLEGNTTIDEICELLCREYDVGEEQCREDVLSICNRLLEEDMLVVDGG